jgi:hypothetical protein
MTDELNEQTNLVAGLAGIFASRLFDLADASCLILSDVGSEFDGTLTQLGLTRDHEVDVSLLAAKVATQLLDLIQNDLGNSYPSVVSYWELCLKLVVSSPFCSCDLYSRDCSGGFD